ncbi:hypothetical protein [Amycolatopsis sp. lyj-84]|uniref:hypothetical protein n=1 Tax=Amycolatopsis sp. lyj-84 TaxID=2789284 RepID=UPI0039787844
MNRRAAPALAAASIALLSACGPRYDEASTEPVPHLGGRLRGTPRELANKVQYEIKGRAEDMIGGPNPGLTLQCGEFSGSSLSIAS